MVGVRSGAGSKAAPAVERPRRPPSAVQVQHVVEPGVLDPEAVVTPGIYVDRIVQGGRYEKRIEKKVIRG